MKLATETITLLCDVYDEKNNLLLLSKGTKLELTRHRREKLRHMGILDDILEAATPKRAIAKEERNANMNTIGDISLSEETVIQQHTQKINEAAASLFVNSSLLDESHFLEAATITEKMVYNCRDKAWYHHFIALMNHAKILYSHSINVALLSTLIGLKLDYGAAALQKLVLGALLHDVGQLVLPKKILLKPSKLTDVEYAIVKSHCELGYYMMQDAGLDDSLNQIILQHHERNDGSGYPKGLHESEILQTAKIVGIAEFFDTATTELVYKKAKSAREAINCLRLFPQLYDQHLVGIISKYML